MLALRVATILAAAVGQYAQKLDIVLLEQWHHPIIEQIGRRDLWKRSQMPLAMVFTTSAFGYFWSGSPCPA